MLKQLESMTVERRGAVTEITLCRPDKNNSLDKHFRKDMFATMTELADDEETRAVVFASTGNVFSAGGDFDMFYDINKDARARDKLMIEARRFLNALLDVPQPVIAAVHGSAIGAGATFALLSDAVVASRNVTIGDAHVKIGLVAGEGGCIVWPGAAGMLRARRYLLTGDPIDAESAYQFGLVTDLVEKPEDVLPAARALAERIAGLPPLAVQGTKRALSRVLHQRANEVIDLSLTYEGQTFASEDLLEAIAAFKDRRQPVFHGR